MARWRSRKAPPQGVRIEGTGTEAPRPRGPKGKRDPRVVQWYATKGDAVIAACKRLGIPRPNIPWVIAQARMETNTKSTIGMNNLFNMTGKGTDGFTERSVPEYDDQGTRYIATQKFSNYRNVDEAVAAYHHRISRLWPDAYEQLHSEEGRISDFAKGLVHGVGGRKYGTDPHYVEKMVRASAFYVQEMDKYEIVY